MKSNGAPEKIYLTSDEKNSYVFTQKRSDGIGIKYTRTDAFIEKAIGWLKEQDEMCGVSFQEDFLERFKNYMKRE